MDARSFAILGLFPTREQQRGGLNDRESHRDDEPWTLGPIPARLDFAGRKAREATSRVGARSTDTSPKPCPTAHGNPASAVGAR